MRKLLSTFAAVLLVVAPAVALAADVTGTWTGSIDAGGNAIPISFTFKQDGAKITGTVQGPSDPLAITDGKIDGDKVSFKVSFNGTTITHEGTVTGDEMKLTSKSDQGDFGGQMTLKRAPSAGGPSAAPVSPSSVTPPAH